MSPRPQWTFVSNHGAVLALLAVHKQIAASKVAEQLGISERAVRRIVRDLEQSGYLIRQRNGRLNHYEVNQEMPLRRNGADGLTVNDLVMLFEKSQ